MNAHEMYTLIQETQACEGLEEWLKDHLLPRMRTSSDMRVRIDSKRVPWDRVSFIRDMEKLGYVMDYDCEDRPCAEPYYTIALVFNKFTINPR